MGQSVSKTASKVASRFKGPASTATAVTSKPSVDQYADPLTGFHRGQGPIRNVRDDMQKKFLQSQQINKKGGAEMPEDLIKFIQDVGPLKHKQAEQKEMKKLDSKEESKSKRKLRLPPQLRQQEIEQQQQQSSSETPFKDATRKVSPMRLAEKVEGFDTNRTTSFSYKEDVDDPKDYGIDSFGLFGLLSERNNGKSSDSNQIVNSFYKESTKDRKSSLFTDKESQQHKELLENTLKFIEIPFLLKDSDDSYVGAWPEKVPVLKQMQLSEIPKDRVKIVLEDLGELKAREESAEKTTI